MRKKLEEIPLEIRRRVANKLESIRGTAMAPGGESSYLGKEVCPIYRPDIKDVAYWEFEIAGLKDVRSREHEGKSSGLGFILVSTGKHDIPFPHWSLTNESPSRALEAKSKQGQVARVIKLDTLAYAAEDAKGNYLAHIGQFPLQIIGTEIDPLKYRGISTVTATPKNLSKDDAAPPELTIESTGEKVPKLKLSSWESLTAFKRGYAKAYKPFLKALAERALQPWETEDLITKFGEGIHEGQRLILPLLQPGKVKITGEGARFVKLTLLDRQPPAVSLEALSSNEKKEANIQLQISYKDGTSESLPFFVVPAGTPSNTRRTLPPL